jgi:hypothetical protein
MLVANFVTNRPTMSDTRTYEDFSKFLGERPHRLGVVSRLYPELTATFLTESLRNIFYGETKKASGFQNIDSTYFEWEVETNYIKRIPFAAVPVEDGADGSEIEMIFPENYYQLHEIFKIEKTGQQCFVVSRPVRKSDKEWSVMVRLLDDDYSSILDKDGCQIGDTTRFIGNAKPELHDTGFVKYQSNIEKMRNYMTTVRVDDSYSSKYALMEDTFIKIGKGENQGCLTEKIYKLDPMKKNLIENFLYARENMILLAKGTIGVDGKSTLSDRGTGRPIYIGDGMIPQIERFASKYAANKVTINTFHTIISTMVEKAEKPTGNHFSFIVNERMWAIVQRVLGDYLANRHTDESYIWSRGGEGKYIKVGATFDAYEWGGNTVSFKVDRTLSREFPEPYALCIDLTTGKTSTQPPVAMYSLKGKDYIFNEVLGVGGRTGGDSGVVSTPVAGGMMTIHGYAGIAVYNPYRSFILRAKE